MGPQRACIQKPLTHTSGRSTTRRRRKRLAERKTATMPPKKKAKTKIKPNVLSAKFAGGVRRSEALGNVVVGASTGNIPQTIAGGAGIFGALNIPPIIIIPCS